MMESLRSATRNTGFERWLDAALRPPPRADAPALPDDSPKVPPPPSCSPGHANCYNALRPRLVCMATGPGLHRRCLSNSRVTEPVSCTSQLRVLVTGGRQQPAGQPPWQ